MVVRNQKGSLVVMLVIGLLFVGILGAAYYFFFSAIDEKGRRPASDPKDDFEVLRVRVEAALNDNSLNASVQRNPNTFVCLFTAEAVCLNKGGTFLLYESMEPSAHPLSQLVKENGLGADGLGCKGFPNDACPFHVETEWKPICAPGGCGNTKSMNVNAKVTYNLGDGKIQPIVWTKEIMFSPLLTVSPQVLCEREGRVWDRGNCVNPLAQTRNFATDQRPPAPDMIAPDMPQIPPPPVQEVEYVCPTSIVVQGLEYTVETLRVNRAQVRIPATNGCPGEDTFVFQCTAKNPPNFEGEGQWVQVEAAMAPPCDEQGNPLNGPTFRQ